MRTAVRTFQSEIKIMVIINQIDACFFAEDGQRFGIEVDKLIISRSGQPGRFVQNTIQGDYAVCTDC